MTIIEILFWASAAIIAYTFVGYGVLVWFLVRLRRMLSVSRKETYV